MIHSMTGYGTATCQADGALATAEVRSVNHRFLDLHIRISREYAFLETEIQQLVRGQLRRGRVDLNISVQTPVLGEYLVDAAAARQYLEAARKLRSDLEVEGSLDLQTLLTLPGVLHGRESLQAVQEPAVRAVGDLVLESARRALEAVSRMRAREGEAIGADLSGRLDGIDDNLREIEVLAPETVNEYRSRLEARIALLLSDGGIDEQRMAQEVALAAEKSDISEEILRLKSHVEQFRKLIDSEAEVGKKMDFLLQEMQREANTILSKSGGLEITRHGIAIKSDIEKLREQVQNVE